MSSYNHKKNLPNDPLNAYWEKRAKELPHFEPAHITQGKIASLPQNMPKDFGEKDISDILKQRMANAVVNSVGSSGNSQTVNLKEGYRYYTIINSQGFGHTITLAKIGGIIGGQSAKNVVLKNERKCLVVDGMESVDFSKINENSPNVLHLMEITVPLVGTFLVQREAIVYNNAGGGNVGPGNGRQILKG